MHRNRNPFGFESQGQSQSDRVRISVLEGRVETLEKSHKELVKLLKDKYGESFIPVANVRPLSPSFRRAPAAKSTTSTEGREDGPLKKRPRQEERESWSEMDMDACDVEVVDLADDDDFQDKDNSGDHGSEDVGESGMKIIGCVSLAPIPNPNTGEEFVTLSQISTFANANDSSQNCNVDFSQSGSESIVNVNQDEKSFGFSGTEITKYFQPKKRLSMGKKSLSVVDGSTESAVSYKENEHGNLPPQGQEQPTSASTFSLSRKKRSKSSVSSSHSRHNGDGGSKDTPVENDVPNHKPVPKPAEHGVMGDKPVPVTVENAVNQPEDDPEDTPCSVCLDPITEDGNNILFCDKCNLAVHQACYAVPIIPPGSEPWYCNPCKESEGGIEGPITSKDTTCSICLKSGGALKQFKNGTPKKKWAHVYCSYWINGLNVGDPLNRLEGDFILNFHKIEKARWSLHCAICGKKGGACIQCQSGRHCKVAYHPMCGRDCTKTQMAIGNDKKLNLKYVTNCEHHHVDLDKALPI